MNNENQIFRMTLNCIISTNWNVIRDRLIRFIDESDDIILINVLAFFKFKNGCNQYETFLNLIDSKLRERILKNQTEILERVKNNYERIK